MKMLKITLQGKTYEVGVEVMEDAPAAPSTPSAASAPVVLASAPVALPRVPAAVVAAPVSAGGPFVTSPMPGLVLKMCVTVGQQVAKDQEVLILDAMKMESPVCAPGAGTIASIHVKEGDAVVEGQVLIELA